MLVTINLLPKESAAKRVREPLLAMPKRKNEMPDAVKVAIVRAGAFYICSDEVMKLLAPRVQYMEFAEVCSDREREERTTYCGKHTKKVRGETLNKFGATLERATDEEILDFLKKGQLKIPRERWCSENVRRVAVKAMLASLGSDARKITQHDFYDNGLRGVLKYYGDSPYEALVDAGIDIKPWEMAFAPRGFYENRENRVAATRWLVTKLGKDPKEITENDFYDNIRGVTVYYDTIYDALKDAGFELQPWEMAHVAHGFYEDRNSRINAIRWLVEGLKKPVALITKEDFETNGLSGLLHYYNNTAYNALIDAGFAINPWEMGSTPNGFYKERENRVEAIRWLVEKLRKDVRRITAIDFKENGLDGLLSNYYGSSPYKALKDAGFVSMPLEMEKVPQGFWGKKESRVDATRRLVDALGKEAREVTKDDFSANGLSGILKYCSPYEALLEAGLITEADEEYVRGRGMRNLRTPSTIPGEEHEDDG